LLRASGPLVVGLTVDPARLAVVRAARLSALNDEANTDYADFDVLRKEVLEARRLFIRRGWPIIDASHRSIEQTASMIIDMLRKRAGESH
jgi:regulator of PEP synthase PpsR (kinase-PPPase family)